MQTALPGTRTLVATGDLALKQTSPHRTILADFEVSRRRVLHRNIIPYYHIVIFPAMRVARGMRLSSVLQPLQQSLTLSQVKTPVNITSCAVKI